jgi:hypothetical protein
MGNYVAKEIENGISEYYESQWELEDTGYSRESWENDGEHDANYYEFVYSYILKIGVHCFEFGWAESGEKVFNEYGYCTDHHSWSDYPVTMDGKFFLPQRYSLRLVEFANKLLKQEGADTKKRLLNEINRLRAEYIKNKDLFFKEQKLFEERGYC